MNKWFACLAALIFSTGLLAGTTGAPASLITVPGKVNADFLNMRTGAGLNFPVAGKITQNSEVKIVREIGNWLELTAPEGLKIYISEARVNPDGTLIGELNMRCAMSTSAPILGVLPKGAKVQRLDERRNGWVRIMPPESVRVYVAAFCVIYDKSAFNEKGLPVNAAAPAAEAVKEEKSADTAAPAAEAVKIELSGVVTAWEYSKTPETAFALLDAPNGKNLAFITAEKAETISAFAGKSVNVSGKVIKTTDAGAKVVCVEQITEITVE